MANLENLEHRKPFEAGSERLRQAVAKSTATKMRRKNMRETVLAMMEARPKPTDELLRDLRKMGLENPEPDLQTIICANLLSIATLKRAPKSALQAIEIIGELTGCDASTKIASERMKLERARLKLERERFEFEKARTQAGDDDGTVVIEV